MAKKDDHIIMRNSKFFCSNCGQAQEIPYPLPIPMFTAMCKAFNKMHINCPKTWVQPVVDQLMTLSQKQAFWIKEGEQGTSSKTMFRYLSGKEIFDNNDSHPCDPDDFRRCYLLLKTIPEWKSKLEVLKPISKVWGNLVDNWAKLTDMLEEQMRTKKPNGMYEFMKELGC